MWRGTEVGPAGAAICDDSFGGNHTGERPHIPRAWMPRRAVALGTIGIALLVVANVAVFQRRQPASAGGSLRAQVLKFAASEVATGALEGSSPLPLPPPPPSPPPPPPPLTSLPPPLPPVDGQIAEEPPAAPIGTTAAAPAVENSHSHGCPAGMQTATDPALSDDPSTDCTRRH
eukprot:COSAG03_NODE_4550_length_1511_cov_21.332153_1_plen_173_part_10